MHATAGEAREGHGPCCREKASTAAQSTPRRQRPLARATATIAIAKVAAEVARPRTATLQSEVKPSRRFA